MLNRIGTYPGFYLSEMLYEHLTFGFFMHISTLNTSLSPPPDYDSVLIESIGPEITRFIESKGGFTTESLSKKLLDYLITTHNSRHSQNYILSSGSNFRGTASGGASVADMTRQKILTMFPDMDPKIAEISRSVPHGKAALKATVHKHLLLCSRLIQTYAQQELMNVNDKRERFKVLDSFEVKARLRVDNYRTTDDPDLLYKLLTSDLLDFSCRPDQAIAKIEAIFKATLGIKLL